MRQPQTMQELFPVIQEAYRQKHVNEWRSIPPEQMPHRDLVLADFEARKPGRKLRKQGRQYAEEHLGMAPEKKSEGRRVARVIAGVALAATVSGGIMLARAGVNAHETNTREASISQQTDTANQVQPEMIKLDKAMLAAREAHPENFAKPVNVGNGAVEIHDINPDLVGDKITAVMGTYKSGPNKGQPNPKDPRYFDSFSGDKFGGTLISLATPKGAAYAASHDHPDTGGYYAAEQDLTNVTRDPINDSPLWHTTEQLASNVSAANTNGSGMLGYDANENPIPDTPTGRTGQVIGDLNNELTSSGSQDLPSSF